MQVALAYFEKHTQPATPPPLPLASAPADLPALKAACDTAWATFETTRSAEAALAYEASVRAVGAAIAAHADTDTPAAADIARDALATPVEATPGAPPVLVQAGLSAATMKAARTRAAAYRETLTALRPFGAAHTLHPRTRPEARAALAAALPNYPADWIAESASRNDTRRRLHVAFTEAGQRAHYNARRALPVGDFTNTEIAAATVPDGTDPATVLTPTKGQWVEPIPDMEATPTIVGAGGKPAPAVGRGWRLMGRRRRDDDVATLTLVPTPGEDVPGETVAIHEFAHRVEATNPRIVTACHTFRLNHAFTTPDGRPQRHLRGKSLYMTGDYPHEYVGRDYATTQGPSTPHTEVFSMGMEAIFGGAHHGFSLHGNQSERDTRDLVLGLLATA